MRIRQSAAMVVVVSALFLVGNTAHAGWFDWLWPFGSQAPREQTPSAGAQMPPPGGAQPPSGGTFTPSPSGDQGFQPQQPQQPSTNNQPSGQGFQPNQPVRQFNQEPSNQQGTSTQNQQNQFNLQNQKQGQSGQTGGRFFCNSLGREANAQECDAADKAKGSQPNQQGQGEMKPPFPQGDDEHTKKEQEEKYRMESEQSRKQTEEKMRQEEMTKKEQTMRQQPQTTQMPFPGQGATDGKFPGQGATQGNFPGGKEGQQNQQFNFDEQQEPQRQVFIDPQFVKQVTREITDQTRELNRMLKAAKKLAGAEVAVAKVQELLNKVNEFKSKIKSVQGEELQEAIDDFHNEQIWDSLNGIRAIVELPKQLKEMDRSITRVEKLFKNKAVKRLADWGVDLSKMQADVAAIREKVTNVKSLLSAGSGEEAQEAMQDVWEEGFHPGEIEGALQQMRGMTDNLRRIRNKEVQAMVKEVFQPVIDAINDGDYREANQLLNELQFEMQRVFAQLYRLKAKSTLSTDLKSKLDAFESRIQDKLQGQGTEPTRSLEAAPEEGF